MTTAHSADLEQLAGIGAVRYMRGDRPTAPPIGGGTEPGWLRTMPFPAGESADHRVPPETDRNVHIWIQIATLSAADLGLLRQAVWSISPRIEVSCPDPDGRLVRIAFPGGQMTPVRDWVRAVVQIPVTAIHASRPVTSVLIGLERS